MPKLTKRIVDAVEPSDRDAFLWDSEVKGFGLKATPTGAKSYVLQYRTPEGRSRRFTIGKHGSPWTCEEARKRAVDLLRGLADGVDPLQAKTEARSVLTVKELAELYLAEGPAEKPNKKASSWETDASNFRRHIIPLLGVRSIKSITPSDISKLQADVAAGKTATDVRTGWRGRARVRGGKGIASRAVAAIGAAYTFAVGRGLVSANPARGVKLLKGEKKERFLSEREVAALADALTVMEEEVKLHPRMATAIRLLMLTGCRKGEILGLQWSWIDFERGIIRLPDSKTGAKVVPLPPPALEILAGLAWVKGNPHVLPAIRGDEKGPLNGLQSAWESVRRRATALARQRAEEAGEPLEHSPDLTGVRLHDLRHSYASFAVADGATLFLVGKVLGHRQARTTEVYAHLRDDPLKAVADRTAKKIADAMRLGEARERPRADVIQILKNR